MADMAMHKRPARHAGELGLFVDSPLFEEEFSTIRQGAEVSVTATQSRSLKQMRLAWGLCRKISDSGALGEADTREVMQYILLKAKHVRYVTNVHRDGTEITPIVKSIRFAQMDQTAFTRLFDRMLWIVATDILPEVPEGTLREEIEKMAGVGVPEPEAKPARRRRSGVSGKTETQVITDDPFAPDHDPHTGEVHEIPATEPVMTSDFPKSNSSAHPAPEGPPPEGAGPDSEVPPPPQRKEQPTPETPAATPAPSAAVSRPAQATPRNADDWVAFAYDWLADAKDNPAETDQTVMMRWNNERGLRSDCGVTLEIREPVFRLYTEVIESKRKAA